MPVLAPLTRSRPPLQPPCDLLRRLRDCTREQHARLDSSLDFGQTLTRGRYSAFLRGVLAVVEPLEGALEHWFARGARSECLRRDLDQLGVNVEVTPAAFRRPADIAEAYGCAYVLEGSSLGGIVLAPIVEKAFGDGFATSYLRFRGDDTGRAWRAWLDDLNAFGESATAPQMLRACDMARATFDSYAGSLRASGALTEQRT